MRAIWIGGLFALSLLTFVTAARQWLRVDSTWWGRLYVLLVCGGYLLPSALTVATGKLVKQVDAFGNTNVIAPSVGIFSLQTMTVVMVIVGLAILVLSNKFDLRSSLRVDGALVGAVCIFCIGAMAGAYWNQTPLLTPRQLLLALMAACALKLRDRGIRNFTLWITSLCLIVSVNGLSSVIPNGSTLAECGANKCNISGFVLLGLNENGNALGLFTALVVAPVMIYAHGRLRNLWVATLLCVILLSGSRTSLAAALISVIATLLPALRKRVTGICTVSLMVGVVLPFIPWSADSFGLRGYMWNVARDSATAHPWFGVGWDSVEAALTQSGTTKGFSFYSMHNQWIDLIFTSGAVGALVGVLSLLTAWRRSPEKVALLILPVSILMWFERPWNLWSFDIYSWSLILFGLVISRGPHYEALSIGVLPRITKEAGRE